MAQTLESLVVDLRARTKNLERDLDKANRAIARKMKVQGRTMAKDLSAGFTAAFGKVAAFAGVGIGLEGIRRGIIDTVKTSSQLQTTADKLGLTTTSLQELRYAAEQFNIEQRTVDMALQRFTRRLGEADQGTGELKATLDQYGIATRDSEGHMRSTIDVLSEYADVVQDAESDQERLRLGFKAFDSEGVAFVNMLRDGAAGLARLSVQAHALNGVIDATKVRRYAELDRQIKNISISWATMQADLLSGVLDVGEALGLGGVENQLAGIQGRIRGLQMKMDLPAIRNNPDQPMFQMLQEDLDVWVIKLDRALMTAAQHISNTGRLLNTEIENAFANRKVFDAQSESYALLSRRISRLYDERWELSELETELIDKYPGFVAILDELRMAEEGRANAMALTAEETSRLNSLLASTITPAERFEEQVRLLEKAMLAFPDRAAEFEEAMARIRAAYEEELKKDKLNEFSDAWEDMSKRMSGGLSEALSEGGDAMDNFLKRMLMKLASAALEAAIIAPFLNAIGLGSLGGLFGGAFAAGGEPPVGRPSLVGERGPELFVPKTSGTIIPNHALAGMGGRGDTITVNQSLHFDVGLESVDSRISSVLPMVMRATEAAISDKRRRKPF